MAVVRHIRIANFRGIKDLEWAPSPGVNCLIGPGDSGKTTILDAIDLCLSPRRYAAFGEADFHLMDTSNPIRVHVTLGGLEDELLDVETYLGWQRGWGAEGVDDEPASALETVLTMLMEVGDDLLPHWRLYSERTEERGDRERDLSAKDRARVAPTRLGAFAQSHLAWGQRSILTRIGDERPDAGAALAEARMAAKAAFGSMVGTLFDDALKEVILVAGDLAVNLGEGAKALLDTQQVSMGNGAVALHDANDVPLRNLGLGSSRLIVAGLQRRASRGAIAIVDEVEHGLEPFRIVQLLHVLGSKGDGAPQVFLTTHSPVVLRELSSEQIVVVRRPDRGMGAHRAMAVGSEDKRQATVRACAEAFLTRRVLVCEGKTEVGLMRGLDLHFHETDELTLARCGVYAADGGGTEATHRAITFAELGYCTALFRDDDVELSPRQLGALRSAGVRVFQWNDHLATEAALFRGSPDAAIRELLAIAVDIRGKGAVEADIAAVTGGAMTLESCLAAPGDPGVRRALEAASVRREKDARNWFKLIEAGERVGHEVVPKYKAQFEPSVRGVLKDLFDWIREGVLR